MFFSETYSLLRQENTIFSLFIGTTDSFSKLLTHLAKLRNKKTEGTRRTTFAPSVSDVLYYRNYPTSYSYSIYG